MAVTEIQSTLLNAVTTTGPSSAIDLTLQPCQWLVLTVHANNAQVQLEYSFTGVEGSFIPAVAIGGTVNPVAIVQQTAVIMCSGAFRFVRANVLNIQNGNVTAILQGYPFDFPIPATPVQGIIGLPVPGIGGAPLPPGSLQTLRLGAYGQQLVSQVGGKYSELVRSGQVFVAALQGTQALSTNSTTATGIIISNPEGSPVNCEILEVQVALASLPAGQSNLILTGQSARPTSPTPVSHTTQLPIRNALIGSLAVGYCKADSAATLPAALIQYHLGAGTAATVATSTAFPPYIRDDVDGLVTLGPGTCTSLQALTTAITVVGHIAYREVPL